MVFNPDDPREHSRKPEALGSIAKRTLAARAPVGASRPRYETELDLSNEEFFAHEMENAWKVNLVKLPVRYVADFAAFSRANGELKALIEVKCRTCAADTYPTFGMSLHKWLECTSHAEALGVPFILAVRWLQGPSSKYYKYEPLGATPTTPKEWVRPGGRTDRDDPQDQEVWIHIPIRDFKEF